MHVEIGEQRVGTGEGPFTAVYEAHMDSDDAARGGFRTV